MNLLYGYHAVKLERWERGNTQEAELQEKCEKSSQYYWKNVISRAKTAVKM
jgi:hypothetical protein